MVAPGGLENRSIRSSCLANPSPLSWARRCSGATTIRLFSSLIALVRLIKMPCRDQYLTKCLPESAVTRSGLFGLGERGSRGLDGVDPVVLGAAGTLVVLNLNNVFTRLG